MISALRQTSTLFSVSWKILLGLAALSAFFSPWVSAVLLIASVLSFQAYRDLRKTEAFTHTLQEENASLRKLAEKTRRKLLLSEKKARYFEAILQNNLDPIFTTDADHRIMRFNRGSEELFGYSQEEILGQSVQRLFYDETELQRLLKKVQNKGSANTMEIRALSKNGRIIHLNLSIARMDPRTYGGIYAGCVYSCQDIGRRKAIEREMLSRANELEKLSRTDALTGLYNRRQFEEDLNRCIQSSQENPGQILSLMVLDLDKFKTLNDRQGHQAGDRALRHLAEALRRGVRDMDLCYRFGGDEFVVILRGADSAQSFIVAERIRNHYAQIKDPANDTTVSIGIATYNGQESLEELFQRADTAMYQSKSAGGSLSTTA